MCEERQLLVCTHTHTQTRFQLERQKKQCVPPLRYYQLARAAKARQDAKTCLLHPLTHLTASFCGHIHSAISDGFKFCS